MSTPDLDRPLRCTLLGFSRSLLAWYLAPRSSRGAQPELAGDAAILETTPGLFVTLRRNGELRGCIGSIRTESPLRATLPRVTRKAAFEDPRFPPLRREELSLCTIEHSLLTVPTRVAALANIRLGEDGVILTVQGRQAVFLPEVAREQGWDLNTTLSALARKAGLSPDAWRDSRAEFEVFQTLHYGEEECSDRDL